MNQEHQKIKDFFQVLNYLKTAGKQNDFIREVNSGKINLIVRVD